jgi:hypothetical protein
MTDRPEPRIRVRALRAIQYVNAGSDSEYVIPKGMTGSCFGANRLYNEGLRLSVWWDAIAAWIPEEDSAEHRNGQSFVYSSWEDHSVNPDDVEFVMVTYGVTDNQIITPMPSIKRAEEGR